MIDTTALVVHDCQCTIGGDLRPSASAFYRGFIWHLWGETISCLLPVEMTSEEAGLITNPEGVFTTFPSSHNLGSTEVQCLALWGGYDVAQRLVDRFWENLGR